MIFCNNNLLTDDVTYTVNVPSVAFPVTKLYDNSTRGLCRFTDTIVIDLGVVQSVDALAIANASTTITIEANSSDSWGSPPFSKTMSVIAGSNIALELFTSVSYRYWRIVGSSVTTIGHCFIGERYTFPNPVKGSIPQKPTTDITNISNAGVGYTSIGHTRNGQQFQFEWASKSEYDVFIDFWDSSLRVKYGYFAQFEESLTYFKPYFAQLIETNFRTRNDYNALSFDMTVEERK
jgi:hypothetical protein